MPAPSWSRQRRVPHCGQPCVRGRAEVVGRVPFVARTQSRGGPKVRTGRRLTPARPGVLRGLGCLSRYNSRVLRGAPALSGYEARTPPRRWRLGASFAPPRRGAVGLVAWPAGDRTRWGWAMLATAPLGPYRREAPARETSGLLLLAVWRVCGALGGALCRRAMAPIAREARGSARVSGAPPLELALGASACPCRFRCAHCRWSAASCSCARALGGALC